jgi:cysteinyl-tRNA synthetase
MFEDLLRRYLKFVGYEVNQVMNLTDVDDKTIRGAQAAKVSLNEYTATYKKAFFDDLKVLGIEPAEHYPAATDHIGEMIKLIRILEEKGYAYRSDDGSVYFSIAKFEKYGQLAHLDMSGLQAGARVAQDEYDKENLADFALWKAWDEADGEVAWNSPWGRGRPGWHIECSAMAMKYLGESFDIHTGGVDNIFPHHEDEIAQSEAVTGKPFAQYWMHCAHLVVEGRKMSKSLGNFYTLRDILEKGFSGREIRYVLLATHYRKSLDFSFDALRAARTALQRLDEFRGRIRQAAGTEAAVESVPKWIVDARREFSAGLDDDLNISRALAALFDMTHAGNRLLDSGEMSAAEAAAADASLSDFDRVLGVLEPGEEQIDEELQELARQRVVARKNKDWAEADRIRDELAARGWVIQDTPEGPKLKRK